MKKKNLFIFTLLVAVSLFVSPSNCLAKKDKENYHITVTVKNCPDSILLLGQYYAENIYILDTAHLDRHGRYVFSSSQKQLYPGLHFITTYDQREWVDFVIYNEPLDFSFSTDNADWVANMEVKNSRENEIFFDYQRTSGRISREFTEAMAKADSADKASLQRQHQSRQAEVKDSFITRYPNCMISKMMGATRDIVATVPFLSPSGDSLSSRERYDYLMKHYFDFMPLDDDMLVRTPKMVFYQHVMDYYDRYLKGAPPEVIIAYTDSLVAKARPSKEVFKWLVHTIKEKYLRSNITLYEAVAVHMVQRYYATGEAFWCSPTTIDEITERAAKMDRLLIGRTAPELILFDTLHVPHSLHHMPNRYKLLIFWSPTCGHCKTIVPALHKAFAELRKTYDIGGFAILSEPDEATRPKWRQFINQNNLDWVNLDGGEANVDWREVYDVVTTPQIYLLDENNTIIAKKLNAETFRTVVEGLCQKTVDHSPNGSLDSEPRR